MPKILRPKVGFTDQRVGLPSKKLTGTNQVKKRFRAVPFSSPGFIAVMFLIGLSTYTSLLQKTIIPFLDGSLLFLISIISCLAWQYYFGRHVFQLKRMEYLAAGLFGMSPLMAAFFLFLNIAFLREKEITEHRVTDVEINAFNVRFNAEGIPCSEYHDLCNSFDWSLRSLHRGDTVILEKGVGLLGYFVYKDIYPKPQD